MITIRCNYVERAVISSVFQIEGLRRLWVQSRDNRGAASCQEGWAASGCDGNEPTWRESWSSVGGTERSGGLRTERTMETNPQRLAPEKPGACFVWLEKSIRSEWRTMSLTRNSLWWEAHGHLTQALIVRMTHLQLTRKILLRVVVYNKFLRGFFLFILNIRQYIKIFPWEPEPLYSNWCPQISGLNCCFLNVLLLDSGVPVTQSPPTTPGSTATQGSTLTHGSTATQGPPVTTTPEPPLFQNFSGYHIGVGRADCTGQVADISLVGKSWAPQGEWSTFTTCTLHWFLMITSLSSSSFIDFTAV